MKTRLIPSNRNGNNLAFPGGILCCLWVALCLAFAGCGQKDSEPAPVNLAGIYDLVSVDGHDVPCEVSHEGHAMKVKSGGFTIHADGTCSSKVTFAVAGQAEVVREVKATYVREGAKLTMQWEGAGTTTGEVAEGTFTMNNEGMIFVYAK